MGRGQGQAAQGPAACASPLPRGLSSPRSQEAVRGLGTTLPPSAQGSRPPGAVWGHMGGAVQDPSGREGGWARMRCPLAICGIKASRGARRWAGPCALSTLRLQSLPAAPPGRPRRPRGSQPGQRAPAVLRTQPQAWWSPQPSRTGRRGVGAAGNPESAAFAPSPGTSPREGARGRSTSTHRPLLLRLEAHAAPPAAGGPVQGAGGGGVHGAGPAGTLGHTGRVSRAGAPSLPPAPFLHITAGFSNRFGHQGLICGTATSQTQNRFLPHESSRVHPPPAPKEQGLGGLPPAQPGPRSPRRARRVPRGSEL